MTIPRMMPRFKHRLRVRYRDESGEKDFLALTRDLSPSGIGVNSNRPAAPGAHLQLVLEIDDHESIELRGTVVWAHRVPAGMLAVEKGGFGVALTTADERWYTYLSELAA